MNEFIAGVGGGAEGLCLALQQVKSRENGCLGAAAGYKINMLKTALFIQGLLDLGYDFFYCFCHFSSSSKCVSDFPLTKIYKIFK